MDWNTENRRAIKFSLLFHGAVVVLVLIFAGIASLFNKPVIPPHVFELQGIKGPEHVGAPGRLAGRRDLPRTNQASSGPQNVAIPNLDRSAPAPEPAAAAPAQPQPAAAKPKKPARPQQAQPPKVKPRPNANGTRPKPMSYEEWAKQNKRPASGAKTKAAQTPRSGTASNSQGAAHKNAGGASINASAIVSDMKNNLAWGDGGNGGGGAAGGTGVTSGDMDALGEYFMRVRALIDANFRNPRGVTDDAKANVGFTIQANGLVTDVSLRQSSGNAAFDAAAVAAVRALGRLDPPPGNCAYTKNIDFVGTLDAQ